MRHEQFSTLRLEVPGEELPRGPGVYLLELEEPLSTSRREAYYYLGSAKSLCERVAQHRDPVAKGYSGSFVREANRRGIAWAVCLIIPCSSEKEARRLESALKKGKKSYRRPLELAREALKPPRRGIAACATRIPSTLAFGLLGSPVPALARAGRAA